MSSIPIRFPAAGAALLAGALLACGGSGATESRPIARERRWIPVGERAVPGRTSAERFGFERRSPSPADHGGLVWTTPPGWLELAPRSMRVANFAVAGDERAECTLTILGGDGGGLLSNLNRWREQMSLSPIDADALDAAPRAPLLGAEGVLVDLRGEWVGRGGDASGADHRLVGLISIADGAARFLKMTGPAEVLDSEVEAFLALAASFRRNGGPQAGPVAVPETGPRAASGGRETRVPSSSGLAWTAPAGWTRGPDRPMREVTFHLGEGGAGECYVTVLGGAAGGAFANVNRWRGQMGQPDISRAEFEALRRVSMLGTEGVVVEVEGTYRGMGGELVERARLLGAVCELPGRAVFVKLIGPDGLARGAREDFLAFCGSLAES